MLRTMYECGALIAQERHSGPAVDMLTSTKEEDEQMVDKIRQEDELASNDDDIQVDLPLCWYPGCIDSFGKLFTSLYFL